MRVDKLIVVFLLVSLINTLTSRKKKRKQAEQKGGAQRAAAQPQAKAKPNPAPKPKAQPQQRIPFSREEWKAYLMEMAAQQEPKPMTVAPARPAEDAHEGFVSTQGESAEEHAEHHRRIVEEEMQRHQEREMLEDLRNANLEKLRAAVVMSEVLGKPVALRERTGLHR